MKCHPWFVSDTMSKDLEWTLVQLETNNHNGMNIETQFDCSETARRWRTYLKEGIWTVCEDPFWTFPHDYSQTKSVDPDLYRSMSECDLVIFKGDLNYRKLVGDLDWPTTTSFETALQGFHPAPILALRTLVIIELKVSDVTYWQESKIYHSVLARRHWSK